MADSVDTDQIVPSDPSSLHCAQNHVSIHRIFMVFYYVLLLVTEHAVLEYNKAVS